MDISLTLASTTLVLNGAGAAAPLRAGKLTLPGPDSAELELALEGSAASIAAFVQSIERLLYQAELWYGLPGETWGYLQVTPPEGGAWRSPIRSGRCEALPPGASARGGSSQGLRLRLSRDPYWEAAALSEVPLSNRYGSGVSGGLAVDNHDDASHDNWVQLAAEAVGGDVPAPALITLTCASPGMEYLVGQAANSGLPNGVLEAETGSPGASGSNAADAACSSGAYRPMTWSGSAAAVLDCWDLGGDVTRDLRGRIYRPVLRLRDLPGEAILLWWRAAYWNGSAFETLQDFEGVFCGTTQRLVIGPPMPVPPWPAPPSGSAWTSASLLLMAQAAGAGSHALSLDFAQLLPTEGWLRFIPLLSGLPNTEIRYDCVSGQISRAAAAMAAHAVEGSGLMLYPGLTQKIFFLAQSGPNMDIAAVTTVKLEYRARKRAL